MKFLVAALAVLVLLVGAVLFYLGPLLARAIERGAGSALGVETSVDSVRPGLLSGRLELSGLRVANPTGFASPDFLRLREGRVAVDFASLRADTVEIPELALEGIELHLERKVGAGTNYGAILDHLRSLETAEASKPAEASAGDEAPGKKFVIRELRIQDVAARLRLAPELGRLTELDVEVPEIRLQNVGSGAEGGVRLEELCGLIVRALLDAVVRKGGDLGAMGRDLQLRLRGLDRLAGGVAGGLKAAGEDSPQLEERAGQVLRGLGDVLGSQPKD
jgi:hypothetical protein